MRDVAQDVVARCRRIAQFSESQSGTTRTFLCPAMHEVHACLRDWMQSLGMQVSVDAIGNLRGLYSGSNRDGRRRVLMGSHLDTVPDAGAFDGVLGVVLGIALIEALAGKRLPFDVEIIGFSEEEGVRFGIPFLGSRALAGTLNRELLQQRDERGVTICDAIRRFGLDPGGMGSALADPGAFAYVEFHIEQGPVLDDLHQPLGIVQAIAGQSRYQILFKGFANHAGTTPMRLRRDALAGTAEWIGLVEAYAREVPDLVATVGTVRSEPQAGNVIPGVVRASLDVRHASDTTRDEAAARLFSGASEIASRRGLEFSANGRLEQPAVQMNDHLVAVAQKAALSAGCGAPIMTSGAGHDAMILAAQIPSVMFFLRSPRGLSHCPQESVQVEDVELALRVGLQFLTELTTE